MSTKQNLGRVQGSGVFFSALADNGSAIPLNQIKPSQIKPFVGDYILFSTGNLRAIEQIANEQATCGEVLLSVKGADGVGLSSVRQTQTATQSEGINIVTFTLADGSAIDVQIKNGKDGADGKDGASIGIVSATVSYQASANGNTPPSGSWSQNIPSVGNGQYLWTKTTVTYTDGTSTTTYNVGYIGLNGANGKDGADGVGIASVTLSLVSGGGSND